MVVPLLFNKPINVWLGIVLLFLIAFQIFSGIMMRRGRARFLHYHRFNAKLIIIIVIIHAFYGLGIWFFGFRIR